MAQVCQLPPIRPGLTRVTCLLRSRNTISGLTFRKQPASLRRSRAIVRAAVAESDVQQLQRPVKFSIQQRVEFGEAVKLVGAAAEFGGWNPQAAPTLEWGEGHVWTWQGSLPAGEYEFKVVIDREGGEPSWEEGENRKLLVDVGPALLDISMAWGAVGDLVVEEVALNGTAPSAAAAPAGSGNGVLTAADLAALEATAADPDLAAVPVAFDELSADEVSSTNGVANGVHQSTNGTSTNGASAPPASAPPPSAASHAPPASTPSPDPLPAFAAASASAAGTQPASSTSTSADRAPAASRGGSPATSTGEYGWEGAVPSAGPAEVLLSVLAYAAVPVVGWSLFTLHTTGCGLPPGPSGALGAAEGVSYLGVAAMAGYGLYKRASGSPSPGYVVGAELLSYTALAAGLAVLASQVQSYGYIPSALPDANCFGEGAKNAAALALPDIKLGLPDIKLALPAVDLSGVQDSLKQASSSLQSLQSQIPAVDTAALTSQLSEGVKSLTSSLPAPETVVTQLNEGVQSFTSTLPSPELLTAQFNQEMKSLTASLPSGDSIADKFNQGVSFFTASLPSADVLASKISSGVSQAQSIATQVTSQASDSIQAGARRLQEASAQVPSAPAESSSDLSLGLTVKSNLHPRY